MKRWQEPYHIWKVLIVANHKFESCYPKKKKIELEKCRRDVKKKSKKIEGEP